MSETDRLMSMLKLCVTILTLKNNKDTIHTVTQLNHGAKYKWGGSIRWYCFFISY